MKVGVVLNRYPVKSEPFITDFINHFSNETVYVYACFQSDLFLSRKIKYRSLLSCFPTIGLSSFQFLFFLFKFTFYFRRVTKLREKGLKWKRIIIDIPIWTTSKLDILHFPFGTNVIDREHYAEILGAKMTVSFRGSDINVYPVFHSLSYKNIWKFIDAIHCNSKELVWKLREHDVPKTIPIKIIHPCLRQGFRNYVLDRQMNVELGVPSRPLKIISLGRLHWVKDYAFALRVMHLLKQRGVSFEFRILGDGPELEHLMFLSHDLGLEDLVEFSGSKTENEIARYFTKADVYLNTSYSEGMSNACIEAQAIGVPCIVPMISGMEDCIEHGKTGLIVNNRSEKSFVDAIISLINNYNLYDPNYILNRVNEKFNIDKQRVQWHQFFDRVISDAKVRL